MPKIQNMLKMLNNVGYDQIIIKLLSQMLDPQEYSRLTAEQLFNEVS